MGPARVVVMTCREDNQFAGKTYEAPSHELTALLTELPCPYLALSTRVTDPHDAGAVRETGVKITAKWDRAWPWPQQFVQPGGTAEMAWDNTSVGNLFHLDRCQDHSHHLAHAVARQSLLEAFLAATG